MENSLEYYSDTPSFNFETEEKITDDIFSICSESNYYVIFSIIFTFIFCYIFYKYLKKRTLNIEKFNQDEKLTYTIDGKNINVN